MEGVRFCTRVGSALGGLIVLSLAAGPAFAAAAPDISGTYWGTEYRAKIQLVGGGDLPLTPDGRAAYEMNMAGLKDGSLVDGARMRQHHARMPDGREARRHRAQAEIHVVEALAEQRGVEAAKRGPQAAPDRDGVEAHRRQVLHQRSPSCHAPEAFGLAAPRHDGDARGIEKPGSGGHVAMAVKAIKDGAFDFIEKPFDEERLIESIGAAIEHGRRERVEQSERASLEARAAELSPRQLEVMNLVAEGLSNKEIAIRLDISPRTVENYRAWVMEKMGATNLADLVRKTLLLRRPA